MEANKDITSALAQHVNVVKTILEKEQVKLLAPEKYRGVLEFKNNQKEK